MGPGAAADTGTQPARVGDADLSSDDEPLGARFKAGPALKKAIKVSPKVKAETWSPAGGAAAAAAKGAAGKTASKAAAKPAKDKGSAADGVKKEAGGPAVKRERKVYDMPGQTKATPDEMDPLRKFYTSTREQLLHSEMAKRWLLQHGLLPREEAEELVSVLKGLKSPSKAAASRPRLTPKKEAPVKKEKEGSGGGVHGKAAAKRPPKRPADDSDDDDDDDDEDFGAKPAKRPKVAKPAATKAKPADKSAPTKAVAKRTQKDVAFADGGLDSISSDDDL